MARYLAAVSAALIWAAMRTTARRSMNTHMLKQDFSTASSDEDDSARDSLSVSSWMKNKNANLINRDILVSGNMYVIPHAKKGDGNVELFIWHFEGVDPRCTFSKVETYSSSYLNSCAIVVRENKNPDDPIAERYFDRDFLKEDPWKSVKYYTTDAGLTADGRRVLLTGRSFESFVDRIVYVYDYNGKIIGTSSTGLKHSMIQLTKTERYPQMVTIPTQDMDASSHEVSQDETIYDDNISLMQHSDKTTKVSESVEKNKTIEHLKMEEKALIAQQKELEQQHQELIERQAQTRQLKEEKLQQEMAQKHADAVNAVKVAVESDHSDHSDPVEQVQVVADQPFSPPYF